MKEAALRSKIIKALRQYSGYWVVVVANVHGQGGLPDIVGCCQGYFFGLEVKRPGKEHTLTERQAYSLERIRRAGGKATVVTSVQEALSFVFGHLD